MSMSSDMPDLECGCNKCPECVHRLMIQRQKERGPVEVTLDMRDKVGLKVKMDPGEDKIKDLKKKITELEGIHMERQTLYCNGLEIPQSWNDMQVLCAQIYTRRYLTKSLIGVDNQDRCYEEDRSLIRFEVFFPLGSFSKKGQLTFDPSEASCTVIRNWGGPWKDFDAVTINEHTKGVPTRIDKAFWSSTVKFGLVFKTAEVDRGDKGKFYQYEAKLYKVEEGSDIKLQRDNGVWKAYLKKQPATGEDSTFHLEEPDLTPLVPYDIKTFDQSFLTTPLQRAEIALGSAEAAAEFLAPIMGIAGLGI